MTPPKKYFLPVFPPLLGLIPLLNLGSCGTTPSPRSLLMMSELLVHAMFFCLYSYITPAAVVPYFSGFCDTVLNLSKLFFGDPEKSFDRFSTVSQNPEKYGTTAAGVMYEYKQKNMAWTSNSLIISSDLGEGVVPQDPKFNNGINPNNGGKTGKKYFFGGVMHPARGGAIKEADFKGFGRGRGRCGV